PERDPRRPPPTERTVGRRPPRRFGPCLRQSRQQLTRQRRNMGEKTSEDQEAATVRSSATDHCHASTMEANSLGFDAAAAASNSAYSSSAGGNPGQTRSTTAGMGAWER